MTLYSIDCGLKGGISKFIDGEYMSSVAMPTIDNKQKELDGLRIYSILEKADIVVIEQQFIPKGNPQKGTITNIGNFGAIKVIARMCVNDDDMVIVASQTWKRYFNLLNNGRSPLLPKITKKDSVNKCNSLFNTSFKLKDDGLAESALIGLWSIKNKR